MTDPTSPSEPKAQSFLDSLTDEQWVRLLRYAFGPDYAEKCWPKDEPPTDAPVHFQPDQ